MHKRVLMYFLLGKEPAFLTNQLVLLTLLKEKVVERVIFLPNSSEMGVCPYVQEFMSALLKHTQTLNLSYIP